MTSRILFPNRHPTETPGTHGRAILFAWMTVDRHLTLQERTVPPADEWTPEHRGWLVARMAEGAGYWLQDGNARELNVGDGFVMVGFNGKPAPVGLRASQLGPLRIQFFIVQPQYLNGVLTVSEWQQLQAATDRWSPLVSVFSATEPVGQKFTRLAERPGGDGLSLRCALLQLWSSVLPGLRLAPVADANDGNKLSARFRQLLGKMTGAELADASLANLAGQLNCSERHFSRLFREEFGVSLHARQTALRLQRASELLAASNVKIASVAEASGYQHLGLFNLMFKKQFGMTPSAWREAERNQAGRRNLLAGFVLLLPCQFSDLFEMAAGLVA